MRRRHSVSVVLPMGYTSLIPFSGVGMFWGADLVVSRETREPATRLANDVVMKLRQEYGVLLSADGPHSNVLKFKPPLCFNASDLKKAVAALDSALCELTKRR